jgi:hypothetical protein
VLVRDQEFNPPPFWFDRKNKTRCEAFVVGSILGLYRHGCEEKFLGCRLRVNHRELYCHRIAFVQNSFDNATAAHSLIEAVASARSLPMTKLHAISIRQPNVEMILRGIKKVEYRSVPTRKGSEYTSTRRSSPVTGTHGGSSA